MKVYVVIKHSKRLLSSGQKTIEYVYKNDVRADMFATSANKADDLNFYYVEEHEVVE